MSKDILHQLMEFLSAGEPVPQWLARAFREAVERGDIEFRKRAAQRTQKDSLHQLVLIHMVRLADVPKPKVFEMVGKELGMSPQQVRHIYYNDGALRGLVA